MVIYIFNTTGRLISIKTGLCLILYLKLHDLTLIENKKFKLPNHQTKVNWQSNMKINPSKTLAAIFKT